MSDDNICLPFPCVENETTPIENMRKFHSDGEGLNPSRYYFTIPIGKFRPSPCSFLDTASTRGGDGHQLILIALFHLFDKMFYSDDQPDIAFMPDGGRRFRVFMEYLLSDDADPSDFTLIDCVGIRFHIHIYDGAIDFLEGLLKMIYGSDSGGEGDGDGGGAGGDGDGAGGDAPARKRRKTFKKNSPPQKKVKLPLFDSYKDIKSFLIWFRTAGVVAGSSTHVDDYTRCCTTDKHIPDCDHPFHPDNFFTWEHSLVPDMHPSQMTLSDTFSVPTAVYYLTGYLLTPQAILGVTLPRTPMWFNQPDQSMINETMESLYNKEYMEIFFERRARLIKRNDLADIKKVQDLRKKSIMKNTDEADVDATLRRFRERSIKYLANAWNPSAFVSEPIKIMAKVSGEMGSWTTGPLRIIDTEMSAFGNLMADTMFGFENILRISTTHATLLRLLVNSLDAYRYEFNLHNNVLLVGAGAAGKSHLLETLEKVLFVEGTVSKVSHLTDKAITVDSDSNDGMVVMHEMPPLMMGTDGNSGDTGSHLIKDVMTSCKMETQSITVDEGRRLAVNASSERVGVILMASNEESDKIPEAIATRMILIQVPNSNRHKFTINDMTSSVDGIKGGNYNETGSNGTDFYRRWKVTQILVNMIEKAIFTGALKDVNIRIFETIQLKMTTHMKKTGIMPTGGNDREIKFLKRFARTITIINAANTFVNSPTSPGYDPEGNVRLGSAESFQLLLQIQPYLFCTEEIALFTLTVNADQLIKVHQFQALEVILAMIVPTLVKEGSGKFEEKDGFHFTKPLYLDERIIYRKLQATQNTAEFETSRMSVENLKVAFRELRRRVHNERTIIEFNSASQCISVNVDFLRLHYKWDSGHNRYICKFDLSKVMEKSFNESYANAHTKDMPKMLTGNQYHRNTPFLFNTIHRMPNPNNKLTRTIARSNQVGDEGGFEGTETTDDYVRENDTVTFNVDFENFTYRHHLEKCGYRPEEFDTVKKLYDHGVGAEDINATRDYPLHFSTWFTKVTGVDTAN